VVHGEDEAIAERVGYFCYDDAMCDDLEVFDSTGQFLRARHRGRYAVNFELDTTRPPDPEHASEQLRPWIERTSDHVDYGRAEVDAAGLRDLIEIVRAGRFVPIPTLFNALRSVFRL
jgi:hypothetical protein